MKRFIGSLAAAAMLIVLAPAGRAALSVRWETQLGMIVTAIAPSPDGRAMYVAGSQSNGGSNTEALVAKLTLAGDVVWSRTWLPSNATNPANGGPLWTARATAITATADGSEVFVTGAMQQTHYEGGRWFIRGYGSRAGHLLSTFSSYRWKEPGGGPPQTTSAIVTSGAEVVVAVNSYGCCDDPATDGRIRAFDARLLRPRWHAGFEPPSSIPSAWYDLAEGLSIGSGTNIFVAGWAATGGPPAATDPPATGSLGTVVLEKMNVRGELLWTRTIGVSMFRGAGNVAISVRGDRAMLSAPIDGTGVRWTASKGTRAWLGRLSISDGSVIWSRTWGRGASTAAEPTGVAVDASGVTWVVGTRRDPSDHGLDVFVRRFGRHSGTRDTLSITGPERWLSGGAVALRSHGSARSKGAFITGWVSAPTGGDPNGGRVWRVAV